MKTIITLFVLLAVTLSVVSQKIANQGNYNKTTVFNGGDDNVLVYRIPAILQTKKGTLLAFCEARNGYGDHSANNIVIKRSTDNGSVWGKLITIHDAGRNCLNNPTAVEDEKTGNIILMYQMSPEGYHSDAHGNLKQTKPGVVGNEIRKVFVARSKDDGITWSTPEDVTAQTKRAEKIHFCGSGPGIGIQKKNKPYVGRIIIPFRESYYDEGKYVSRNYAVYSDDNGNTWKYGNVADNSNEGYGDELQMVELKDGSVLANSRSSLGEKLRKLSYSYDGGENWTPLKNHEQLIEPRCAATTITTKIDGEEVLVFVNPASTEKREKGSVLISKDKGETWQNLGIFEPYDFAYSCIVDMGDGLVGCLYETEGYKKINFGIIKIK